MKNVKETAINPPSSIRVSDYKRPVGDEYIPFSEATRENLPTFLVLHRVKSDRYRGGTNQWMIETLFISNASSHQRAMGASTDRRTYAIGVEDKRIYCIGLGPHVVDSITVYVKRSNVERLRPLIELYNRGMNDANAIRDRRSSRAAQTRAYRANLFNSFLS